MLAGRSSLGHSLLPISAQSNQAQLASEFHMASSMACFPGMTPACARLVSRLRESPPRKGFGRVLQLKFTFCALSQCTAVQHAPRYCVCNAPGNMMVLLGVLFARGPMSGARGVAKYPQLICTQPQQHDRLLHSTLRWAKKQCMAFHWSYPLNEPLLFGLPSCMTHHSRASTELHHHCICQDRNITTDCIPVQRKPFTDLGHALCFVEHVV